jgi:Family of unknown function (DUF6166)
VKTDLTIPGTLTTILRRLRVNRVYRGRRLHGEANVTVDGREFDPRPSRRVWNHSPDGWNWGYGGSGPAQLALGILLDLGLPEEVAVALHQSAKWRFVAPLPQDADWQLGGAEVCDWIEAELLRLAAKQQKGQQEVPDDA